MSSHGHSKRDLTQGSITRHLIRLSVPMTWGILAIISFQLVNMFYISMLGTQALAAITFTFPVTYTLFSIVMGMGIATSSVISREIGKGNMARVRRITTHALIIAVLMGAAFAVLGMLFMKPLFRAMGADETMMPIISDYMTVWFLGSVFINLPFVGNAAIRATGDTIFPAAVMTVVAVANAILDPILMFGLLGFPRMEVHGAAISTLIANGCAMLAGLYVIGVRKKMLTRSRRHWRLLGDSAKRLLFIAVPVGVTGIIQPVVNAILIAMLAAFGHEAVAAFGIVSRVEALAFVVIMGVAVGMGPIIGQNFGAAKYERVQETLNKAIAFSVIWSLFVAVILFAFARPVAGLFSHEPGVVDATVLFFMIVPFTYIFGNLVQGWGSAFNAMGYPKRSFVMIFVRLVVLNIPLAMAGAHFYGVAGVFGAIAITNLVTGVIFHVMNRAYCREQMGLAQAA